MSLSEFIINLGENPKVLAAFSSNPTALFDEARLSPDERRAILSKNATQINNCVAHGDRARLELADGVTVVVVVTP